MAVVLTIAGVDRSDYMLAGSWNFNETIGQRNTLTFAVCDLTGAWKPERGQSVLLTVDGTDLFGGYVLYTKDTFPGGIDTVRSECVCVSYEQMMDRRHSWGHTYVNETFGAIFESIVDNSLDAEGFTCGASVVTGPTIPLFEIGEPRPTLREVLDQLCEAASTSSTQYHWDVTPDKDVRAYDQSTYAAPWNITDADPKAVQVDAVVTETAEGLVNRVFVHLGQTLTEEKTDTKVGDGSTRNFRWEPDGGPLALGSAPTITVDTVAQTVGVRGLDTGKQWYWQSGSSDIEQDSGETVLTAGNTLVIVARGLDARTLDPIVDSSAITAEATLQGEGTGYYEAYLTLSEMSTQQDGEALGQAYLDAHKDAAQTFEGRTTTTGLRAGQYLTVNLAKYGINTTMFVQSLTLTDQNGVLVWEFKCATGQLIKDWTAKLARDTVSATVAGGAAVSVGGTTQTFTLSIVPKSADATLDPIPQIVEVDCSGGNVTITLPDCSDWIGSPIVLIKTTAESPTNTLYWNAASGDQISGAASGSITDQWGSITIYATAANTGIIASDAALTSDPAPGPTAPGDVTIGTPIAQESTDLTELQISIPFTAPSPLGTFKGVWCQVEAPDQSTTDPALLDGSHNLSAHQLGGTPKPAVFGPFEYDAGAPLPVSVTIARPDEAMTIRVRLISYSDQIVNAAAGAPSTTFAFTPTDDGGKPNSGTPYADCVTGFVPTVTTLIVGGVSMTQVHCAFAKPTSKRPWDGIYVSVEYTTADGDPTTDIGVIWASGMRSNYFPTPPSQTAKVYARSYRVIDGVDTVNPYVAGITPEASIMLGNDVGGAGSEYAAQVTGFSVTKEVREEGGLSYTYIYATFTKPVDARWQGCIVLVTYDPGGGDTTNMGDVWDTTGSQGVTYSNRFATPNTVQTVTVEARSYTWIEGVQRVNTSGPTTTISIGVTGGTVNPTKLVESLLQNTEFEIAGGVLRMKGLDFTKAFNFNATEFEISGGSYKIKAVDFTKGFNAFDVGVAAVPKITVKDGAGNAIGWVGDDSAGSGYVGGWLKRLLIGGTSPANALFFADSSGNVVATTVLVNDAAAPLGWIGNKDGYAGAWFKRLYVGGTSPANAGLIADSSGNIAAKLVYVHDQSSPLGWIGSSGGYNGAWFKQVYIGGTGPADAPFVANSSGVVSISGSVIVGAVASATAAGYATSAGSATTANSASTVPAGGIQAGTIAAAISMTAPTLTITSGSVTINIDSSNMVKVTNSAFTRYAQVNATDVTVRSTTDAFQYCQMTLGSVHVQAASAVSWAGIASGGYFYTNGGTGASGTISYTKPGGATGTITVSGGIITGWT